MVGALRFFVTVGLFGVGLGVALAAGPSAEAAPADTPPSPINIWPYWTNANQTTPPGLGSEVTTISPNSSAVVTFAHLDGTGGTIPWYTAQVTNTSIPGIFSNTTYDVTKVIDPSFGYPAVGTTEAFDQSLFVTLHNFIIPGDVSAPLFTNDSISDPGVGFGALTVFGPIQNEFVWDTAGIEDQLNIFGLPITLFYFPS